MALLYVAVSSPEYGESKVFLSNFSLAGATARAFFRLSLWNFKEKSISQFLWHSLPESPNPVIGAVNPGGPSTVRPFRDIRLSNEPRIHPYEI